jgi:transcriptional regulator with XRE-family HTH domain
VDQDAPITFGDRLRRLRHDQGLSLRELAKLAHHSKTVVWEWETGLKVPPADVAARLDSILEGGGTLAAAAAQPAANGDASRLAYITAAPRTVDGASVDALAGVLANMRRLEDSVGARPLIAAIASPLRLVESLADEARGPLRTRVVDLAGQWAQFAGWLRASVGQPVKARDWYARTLEHATEAGDVDLIATALSMRGNLAWMARQPGQVIGLSAAAGVRGDSPGIRAMAAQQEARGHAVLGEADQVERLLDKAEDQMDEAAADPDREPPWVYFYTPGYLAMQRGLAYGLLDRPEAAIAALTEGLASTGQDLRGSEFVSVYVLHLAEAHIDAGNRDVAARLLEQVRQVAAATGSDRLAAEVDRLARRIGL